MIIGAIVSLIAVGFLLMSRTGLVAIIGMAFLFLLLHARGRWLALAMFVGVVTVILSLWLTQLGARFLVGVNEALNFDGSSGIPTSWGERVRMYSFSVTTFFDAPVFGHGLGDYKVLAMDYFQANVVRRISGYHPHNHYLYLAVELGLIGLILYLWAHLRLYQVAKSLRSEWRNCCLFFIVVLMTDSMFHAPFWMSDERNFFFPMFGLIAAAALFAPKPDNPDVRVNNSVTAAR